MRKAFFSLWIFLAAHAVAQRDVFEAATIKPSKDAPGQSGWHVRTGTIFLTGQTLKGLIQIAYHVKEDQVTGGPKWITEDRFDVNAKAGNAAEQPKLLLMLQTLLADRFHLVYHHENRILSSYALVVAKSGLKITPSDGSAGSHSDGSKGKITAQGITMAKLADALSRNVDNPVVDLTGVTGTYDFTLEWSTEGDANDLESALFAALQQQLGLRLEMRKLPTDVLVIDKAEQPSEN